MYSFKSRSWSQNASGYTYINRIEHMVCSFDMFVTKGTADVLNNYQLWLTPLPGPLVYLFYFENRMFEALRMRSFSDFTI